MIHASIAFKLFRHFTSPAIVKYTISKQDGKFQLEGPFQPGFVATLEDVGKIDRHISIID